MGHRSDLIVGSSKCLPMNTVFKSLKHINNFTPGLRIDGILGFEFLSQYCIAIDFRKKMIYLHEVTD